MRKILLASAALLLVAGANAQETPAPEAAAAADATAEADATAAGGFDWEALGESTYVNCSGCHQPDGTGVPGAFPPLAGHAAELAAMDGGRDYLIHVLLFGLTGEIEVNGMSYNGMMPAWNSLDDDAIAAVINHIVAGWDDAGLPDGFMPIQPDEVAAVRAEALSPDEVMALRPTGEAADADADAADAPEATATPG